MSAHRTEALGFGLYLVCLAVMVWTIVTEFNAGIWS